MNIKERMKEMANSLASEFGVREVVMVAVPEPKDGILKVEVHTKYRAAKVDLLSAVIEGIGSDFRDEVERNCEHEISRN